MLAYILFLFVYFIIVKGGEDMKEKNNCDLTCNK